MLDYMHEYEKWLQSGALTADEVKELKSIGRNLNQLVTLAHMGRVTVINLDGVRQAFSEFCAAVRLILERKRW